jgi:pterin-4a-carbinolamine dehydratase
VGADENVLVHGLDDREDLLWMHNNEIEVHAMPAHVSLVSSSRSAWVRAIVSAAVATRCLMLPCLIGLREGRRQLACDKRPRVPKMGYEMQGLAFISYRREDTGPIAQVLYLQLKSRFGSGQLFMDVNSLPAGCQWPQRVQDKLLKATVVLAMIGPSWLTASDQWGRRRLDFPDDWVHLELGTALDRDKPIIPLFVGHKFDAPPPDALPDGLQGIFRREGMELRPEVDNWARDMASVARELTRYGLNYEPEAGPRPRPSRKKAKLPGLADHQLSQALDNLDDWEPWEDTLPQEYPRSRQELRKNFFFSSFEEAVEFMTYLTPLFSRLKHHPRWSNEWKTVHIRLTTWDAEDKITDEDVRAAHEVDSAYDEFRAQRGYR